MLKPMEGAPTFRISLFVSKQHTLLILMVQAVYALSLWWSARAWLPQWVLLGIALIWLGFGWWQWQRCRHSRSTCQLSLQQGGLFLSDKEKGLWVDLQSATVWRWLLVINLVVRGAGKKRSLVIYRDSCSVADWRELNVFLRHCVVRGEQRAINAQFLPGRRDPE